MLKTINSIVLGDDNITLPAIFSVKALNTAVADNDQLLNAVGRLRYKVWHDEGMDMSNASDSACMIDAIDHDALIWAIYRGEEIIATARLNVYQDLSQSPTSYMHQLLNDQFPLPVATFTRLVVDKSCRGLNLGKLLDIIRVAQAKVIGVKSVLLMCPPKRVASTEKLGFVHLGKAAPSKLWPDADWMLMKLDL